jgi:predicted nuclease with TOPRIM domain
MPKYFDFRDYAINDFGDLAYMLNDIGDKFEEAEKEQEELNEEIILLESKIEDLENEIAELELKNVEF